LSRAISSSVGIAVCSSYWQWSTAELAFMVQSIDDLYQRLMDFACRVAHAFLRDSGQIATRLTGCEGNEDGGERGRIC
jgi:hypothetical protein